MSDMEKYRALARIVRSVAAYVDDGFTYSEAVTIILLQGETRFREVEIAEAYVLLQAGGPNHGRELESTG